MSKHNMCLRVLGGGSRCECNCEKCKLNGTNLDQILSNKAHMKQPSISRITETGLLELYKNKRENDSNGECKNCGKMFTRRTLKKYEGSCGRCFSSINGITKKNIPRIIKEAVWTTYIGNKLIGSCYICSKEISALSFHAGHIESEYGGGEITVKNLRPTCRSCNSKVGVFNMDDIKNALGHQNRRHTIGHTPDPIIEREEGEISDSDDYTDEVAEETEETEEVKTDYVFVFGEEEGEEEEEDMYREIRRQRKRSWINKLFSFDFLGSQSHSPKERKPNAIQRYKEKALSDKRERTRLKTVRRNIQKEKDKEARDKALKLRLDAFRVEAENKLSHKIEAIREKTEHKISKHERRIQWRSKMYNMFCN